MKVQNFENLIVAWPNKKIPKNNYQSNWIWSLSNAVQEIKFNENLKKYPVSVKLYSNIKDLISYINREAKKDWETAWALKMKKHWIVKIWTYIQNWKTWIVEIEYSQWDKNLLLDWKIVDTFSYWNELNLKSLNKAIENIWKEPKIKIIDNEDVIPPIIPNSSQEDDILDPYTMISNKQINIQTI